MIRVVGAVTVELVSCEDVQCMLDQCHMCVHMDVVPAASTEPIYIQHDLPPQPPPTVTLDTPTNHHP